jgi:mRNA-degrading endonuclease toxin of MazEF toxin-antitoxin module
VVSPDPFNSGKEDLVLAAVTSQVSQIGPAVFVGRGDVEGGALPKDSVARLAKLFTLHSSLVVKRICRLRPAKKVELLAELRRFFR